MTLSRVVWSAAEYRQVENSKLLISGANGFVAEWK